MHIKLFIDCLFIRFFMFKGSCTVVTKPLNPLPLLPKTITRYSALPSGSGLYQKWNFHTSVSFHTTFSIPLLIWSCFNVNSDFSSSYAASEDGAGSDEEPKVNEEEFYFAVAESTSKITIHSIRLTWFFF